MLLLASRFPARVTHGFSTRVGGVSRGAFESLNLGVGWGDDPEAVRENLRRLGEAGDFVPSSLVRVRQVHGDSCVRARDAGPEREGDALFHLRADSRDMVVGVLTADCVPVLLCDADATAVAAVHSGWRGTAAAVVRRAVESLVQAGVSAPSLQAAIGPCIEQEAFEVGEEVAAKFEAAFVRRDASGKAHVDLVGAIRAQLVDAGLRPDAIERVGGCTHAEPARYFSYRRDAYGRPTRTGQHLSFIGFR